MELSIIVAMTHERVIGKNGELPWYLPEDLKLFKQRTLFNNVIMGRKTFESIIKRNGKPLANRNNIVISSTLEPQKEIYLARTMQEAIDHARHLGNSTYVIGGSKVYSDFLDKTNNLYISLIRKKYDGDTFFPECNNQEWYLEDSKVYADFDLVHCKRKRLIDI